MTYQSECRLRFPVPPHTARYLVEGRPVSVDALCVRSMNFTQHWRTPGVVEVRYEIILPGAYALARIEQEWADWVDAYRDDLVPNTPLSQAMDVLGWDEPARVLADPVAAPWVLSSFAHDLLLDWFGDVGPSSSGFVINSIDKACMSGADVWLAGRARPEVPGVNYAFQDY